MPTFPTNPPAVEAYSLRNTGNSYTKTYEYDIAGNRTSFVLTKDGETVHNTVYQYDALNRLTQVFQNGASAATYSYDVNGNRIKLSYGNGVSTEYQYNAANWVTRITSKKNSTVLSSYAYTYYASGNQKSETASVNGTVTSYVYDGLGRLTQESETGALTIGYTYDSAGNRTEMVVSGAENYTTTYTYDANNRLTQENKAEGSTTTTTVYSYDANGNLLQKSNPNGAERYDYNGFNQLTVLKQGTTATTYAYNASGIRTAKQTKNASTYFLLDGGDVVAEYTDGELTASYLRGINLVLRFTVDSVEFYLHNAHGDVIVLTNGSGAVTKRYSYDAFGNEENPDSADTNPFRYCGEYFDKETKTYYLRARYYDPAIGRFTQQDPHWSPANAIYGDNPRKINERQDALGLGTYAYAPEISAIMQSGNLYVYCVNNPVQFVDPHGTVVTPVNIVGAIIGAGLGTVLGIAIAEHYDLTGFAKGAVIAGGTLLVGAVGWFSGTAITAIAKKVLLANQGLLYKIPTSVLNFLGLSQLVQPTGQGHHVLSNPIMNALNAHPTLSGVFNRADSVVKALTQEAHRGYQAWHRFIDKTMVEWLSNPANQNATPNQFLTQLYNLYNTPDMIQRFGQGVLDYIKGLMK